MKKEIFIPFFILFLLLLNCFLKFYGIGNSSFWIDEAYSVSEAQRSLSQVIHDSAATDNPPLYFILLHFWCGAFGISESAVRSMSAVFSIAAALLLFFYAKKNIGLTTAVFVSLVFSLSSQQLFYAQETRNYSLVALLSIISAIYFSELFSSRKAKTLPLLTLANVLLIATHYIAGFLIACEGMVALIFISTNRKFFLQFVLSCSLIILVLLPWASNVFNHIPEPGKFWLEKPTFYNFKGVYIDFAGNKFVTVMMFAIIAAGTFATARRWLVDRKREKLFLPVFFNTWAFIVVVSVYFIAFIRPVFLTRYLLFCAIGLYLGTGYFLSILKLSSGLKISIAVLLLASMAISLKLHPEREEHWREAVNLVKKIKTKDDVVVVSVWYTSNIFSYYYDKDIFRQYNEMDQRLNKENIFATSKMDSVSFQKLPRSRRIILVQSHQVDDDPENSVMNTLSTYTRKTVSADYNKVQVYVFERLAGKK